MDEYYCHLKNGYCTEVCNGKCPYKQTGKRQRNFFGRIIDEITFFFTGKDSSAVDDGISDYSGQGRDSYGR